MTIAQQMLDSYPADLGGLTNKHWPAVSRRAVSVPRRAWRAPTLVSARGWSTS